MNELLDPPVTQPALPLFVRSTFEVPVMLTSAFRLSNAELSSVASVSPGEIVPEPDRGLLVVESPVSVT
ncbi:hypothetical protein [Halorubrum distributum]|uniref:hypothetical protein n=1 Tax=Halorubrum distributum TaxID=29283 RepID=UPI00126750A9|nr:hypothetical protein [Halorubrum litoreum]